MGSTLFMDKKEKNACGNYAEYEANINTRNMLVLA